MQRSRTPTMRPRTMRPHTAGPVVTPGAPSQESQITALGLSEEQVVISDNVTLSKGAVPQGHDPQTLAPEESARRKTVPGKGIRPKRSADLGLVWPNDPEVYDIDAARLASNREWWDNPSPENKPLRDRILAHGGLVALIPRVEYDLQPLLERSEIMNGRGARLQRGKPCQCHGNACRLWDQDPDRYTIMTGYALSKDGLWRQHSCALETLTADGPTLEPTHCTTTGPGKSAGAPLSPGISTPIVPGNDAPPPFRQRIVETTTRRLAYFGFRLTSKESYKFLFNNP